MRRFGQRLGSGSQGSGKQLANDESYSASFMFQGVCGMALSALVLQLQQPLSGNAQGHRSCSGGVTSSGLGAVQAPSVTLQQHITTLVVVLLAAFH